MYNSSFYPTPEKVAHAMLAGFTHEDLAQRSVLEPSAGRGDLAEAVALAMNGPYHALSEFRKRINCVEIEPELQASLRGKGFPMVGTDFLSFWPDERYNMIVMNPPFADGDKHLLHAWEILDHGDILCLLNEQTVQNPSTESRRLLASIIEEHGSTKPLGSCFVDAERKTKVRVSLIHLKKEKEEPAFDFMQAGPEEDPYAAFKDGNSFESELATRNIVGNLVANYDRCRELFLDIAHMTQELGHYIKAFPRFGSEAFADSVKPLIEGKPTRQVQEYAFNTFVRKLKVVAWAQVFQFTKMDNLVSQGVRDEMRVLLQNNERMAFSEANIVSLLETLFLNRGTIMKQCVVEAFDKMTRYYKENRVHVEGWKTNDAWKVNRRVVLPRIIDTSWYAAVHYDKKPILDDIDRGMAFLEGKKLSDVPVTMVQALEALFKDNGAGFSGVLFESTYFEMRAYLKGTLHLKFRDKALWERFNLTAADGKNWLPDDVKAREKADKARNRHADKFGLPLTV